MQDEGHGERRAHLARESFLVVEPGEFARHRLRAALREPGREVYVSGSAHEALGLLHQVRPDVIFLSLDLHDLGGTRVLDIFGQRAAGIPLIAVTEHPTVDGAIAALRHGAVDYLTANLERARLNRASERALHEARAKRDLAAAKEEVRDRYGFSKLLTQSPAMLEVFDQIRAVAVTDATVLILGETGTGKELVSRAIHDRSPRSNKPFISVNCGAFTETLLESELFGHEKGSFTGAVGKREGLFEMADGGSLFLDELGETTLKVQVNLLRVLEEMAFRRVGGRDKVRVDVRIIAATNARLEEAVEQGRFREDLFYRLNVFPIRLPPMRQRREDIPLLMRHFLEEIASEYELDPPSVSSEAMASILGYRWPGNVRQLRAMCERWVITRAAQRLEREHLPPDMSARAGVSGRGGSAPVVDDNLPLSDNIAGVVGQVERAYLCRCLERHAGHLGKTAEAAGITRRTLYTKLKHLGVDAADYRH